jgi:hypothetical protein
MSSGRQAFKLTETARLIRATTLAGLTVRRVTTGPDGRPVLIIADADGEPAPESPRDTSSVNNNEWEEFVRAENAKSET